MLHTPPVPANVAIDAASSDAREPPASRQASGHGGAPLLAASGAASLAVALVAAVVSYLRVARAGLPLGWDEAIHSVASLTLADDLRRHDLVALVRDSDQQVFYPPGMAWFQAPTLVLWPPTDQTARVSSLVALVLLALATWWLGAQLAARSGAASGGLVAAALVVGSPLTLAMATQPMIEVFNGLVVAATLAAQVRFRATDRRRWTLVASLLLLLTILTKYNYAAFVAGAIAVDQTVAGDFKRARLARTFRWFYQPLGIGLAVWFASDLGGKLRTAAGFGISQAIDAHRMWWQELAYYGQALVDGGSRGLLGGVLVAAGLLCAVAVVRGPGARLAWLFVIISLALLTIHPNKQVRFLEPVLPVLLALAGAGLASIPGALGRLDRALAYAARGLVPQPRAITTAGDEPPRYVRGSPAGAERHRQPRGLTVRRVSRAVPAAAALVYAAIQIARITPPSAAEVARGDAIHRAAAFIAAQVPPGKPAILVGTFADFGPYYVTWSLRGAWHTDPSSFITDYSTLPAPGLLPNGEVDATPSPRYAADWATWRAAHADYWLVTLEVRRPSPFWTSEFGSANAWKQNYVAAIQRSGERPSKVMADAEYALTVSVYPPRAAIAP